MDWLFPSLMMEESHDLGKKREIELTQVIAVRFLGANNTDIKDTSCNV